MDRWNVRWCVQLVPLRRLVGRMCTRTQSTSPHSVFEYDTRSGVPCIPWHFCSCGPVWRLLLCGYVCMLSCLVTFYESQSPVLQLWVISGLESHLQSRVCSVCRLFQWRLRAIELVLPCLVHAYVLCVCYSPCEQTRRLIEMRMHHVGFCLCTLHRQQTQLQFSARSFVVIFLYHFCVASIRLFNAAVMRSKSSSSLWILCYNGAFLGILGALPAKLPNVAADGGSFGKNISRCEVLIPRCLWVF